MQPRRTLPACLVFISLSGWRQLLEIEDGAITGMSAVGVDSLQEVYPAAILSQDNRQGSDNPPSGAGL